MSPAAFKRCPAMLIAVWRSAVTFEVRSAFAAAMRTRSCSAAHHLRTDANPAPIAPLPDVRVAARAGRPARFPILGARVDERNVAEDANQHVLAREVREW